MRLLYSLLIIFVIMVALSFWSNHLLQTSADDLLQQTRQIEQGIESINWDAAYSRTVELEKSWEKKAKWWPTILDHQEIDNIEFALAKVKQYILTRDTALSLGQLAELNLMIKHIPEKESITIKNIL